MRQFFSRVVSQDSQTREHNRVIGGMLNESASRPWRDKMAQKLSILGKQKNCIEHFKNITRIIN